ncbi:AAA family ATPase [Pseudomonas sp. BJa3]|uniref:AAA family ATPase n=1 Tax=Pseudomonas sp. BJa3 TaxID=2986525 RepID=UPI002265BDAF|nr:AAA family ATPase [Pseudomonas sp. BJa3]MCX5511095.1 AAA family ATPase [Pseudomonas sp. BJa3]
MKFESLEIVPNAPHGWRSGELEFGAAITQLYAKNGSGKTPLIQAMMFCLGLHVQFRDDIVRNCKMARLKLLLTGKQFTLERMIGDVFDLTVRVDGATENRFYNEVDFSIFMLKALKLRGDRLVTNGNTPIIPYFSALLPLFYLDQDQGYSEYYMPPRPGFITNQFSEMVRLATNFPPQNSYDKKKKAIEVKKDLDYLDAVIVDSGKLLDRIAQDLPSPPRKIEEIDRLIAELKSRLDDLKKSKDIKSDSLSSLDHFVGGLKKRHRELQAEEIAIESKISSATQIREEIQSEIETLNLNEEAKRAFISFSDICTSPSCGIFMVSTDSYGKSLLYLKDQIKDLEISTASNIQKVEALSTEKKFIESQVAQLAQQRGMAEREAGIEIFIEAISRISSEIFELGLEKNKLEKSERQKSIHAELLRKRDMALTLEDSLQASREQSSDILQFRIELGQKMAEWLDVLNSKNISRDIRIDSDLKPILGTEKLGIIKGSSKARTVLAFHAALFELCTNDPLSPFRVLVFDTPRQQEIHWEDLDAYIKALKAVAIRNNAQVIFSTTSYQYAIEDKTDKEWLPQFAGSEQPMYLGRVDQPKMDAGPDVIS